MGGVLALVPARGGSKGLPGKNVKLLHGRSLIARTADTARASGVIDRVVLSTDAADIADEGRRAGLEVPFLRPADLASDESPMLPVIRHAVDALAAAGWLPEIVVLLQPTSPLRRPEHVRAAVDLLRLTRADSVASVVEVPRHLSPDYVMRIDGDDLVNFLPEGAAVKRRQDARAAYVRDGTVYAFWTATLIEQQSIYGRHCRPLIVPASESVTIDSPNDWAEAERRLAIPEPRTRTQN
jgi:CMP-N-acetylneuraminic acid synthetase